MALLDLFHPLFLLAPALVGCLYLELRWRLFEIGKEIPSPPRSLIWGHLEVVGEEMQEVWMGKHPVKSFSENELQT